MHLDETYMKNYNNQSNNNNDKYNYGIVVYLALFIIIIGMFIYSYPREINITHRGVMYKLDGTYTENVEIIIEGNLIKNIFSPNTFKGHITFNDKEMEVYKTMLIDASESKDLFGGYTLTYRNEKTSEAETFGIIYSNSDMSQITILVHEDSKWSTGNGLIVSFPSSTEEDSKDKTLTMVSPTLVNEINKKLSEY